MQNRPEIELLQDVGSFNSNRTATKLIERVFDDILVSYKGKAYHSIYHEYVRKNGYPLPKEVLENPFYVKRDRVENDLKTAISSAQNVVVLGCEGSGKTTLIHRVVGQCASFGRFIYVDTSDLEITTSDDLFLKALLDRFLEAVLNGSSQADRKKFDTWLDSILQKDRLLRSKFKDESSSDTLKNFLTWIAATNEKPVYVILDNIDSLSATAGKAVFSYLNQLNSDITSKLSALDIETLHQMRFIVSCRTTTYRYISAVSTGMFVNWRPSLVQVEDELRDQISVPKLMERFLHNEYPLEFARFKFETQEIPIFRTGTAMGSTFGSYVDTITRYLQRSEDTVNSVIKPFCGRSLRRMKIYGLRAYASPVIAMLAHLEQQKSINISRDDPKYVKRRIYESLFDFRVTGRIDNAISVGFPINLFRVIGEDGEFRRNPLLGPTAIALLHENWADYADDDVVFAHNVRTEPFIDQLLKIGYSDSSIKDLFSVLTASGMLRPIESSGIEMRNESEATSIKKNYILDERSLGAYYDLLSCDDVDRSIQYFNASVRFKYDCGYYGKTDSFQYECLLNLVFLSDILYRENQLAEMNSKSGIAIKSLSSRIRSRLIPFWRRFLQNTATDMQDRKTAGPIGTEGYDVRLFEQNRMLFDDVVRKISQRDSVI